MNKKDDEIEYYWIKLLIFIIIACFAYLSYYKFVIYDKRKVNNKVITENNNTENKDKNNNTEKKLENNINNNNQNELKTNYVNDKDTSIKDNIKDTDNEEKKLADKFFNSFKNSENTKINYVEEVGNEIDDKNAIDILIDDIEIIELMKLTSSTATKDIYEYSSINNEDISEYNKLVGIIFHNLNSSDVTDIVVDAVSANKVRNKYKELYSSNVVFKNSIDESENIGFTGKGSDYESSGLTCSYREKTDMFACRPTHGGVSSEQNYLIRYIYNYKKDSNYYYVYLSVGRLLQYYGQEYNKAIVSNVVKDLKIYKEGSTEELHDFEINETNYKDFDKYRYTFKLNDDGKTFKFISLNRVR